MQERFAANDLSTAASVKDGPGPVIKLNPVQVRIIDALAEVTHIPREKGQTEVVIPEKLRSYKWHLSAEYQDRLKAAAAKARGETGDTQSANSLQDTNRANRTETAPRAQTGQELAKPDEFYQAFWDRVVEQSSIAPQGVDPAFWPNRVLTEFELLASTDRAFIKDKSRYELAGKLAPVKDSIKKIRTAYQIISYPACMSENYREQIEGDLHMDREIHNRDQVELTAPEAAILNRLCETPRYALYSDTKLAEPRIPINPQQRVFKYADVFHPSPNIPKALNGAEWLQWMGERARAARS
jgi:hypothetical protein